MSQSGHLQIGFLVFDNVQSLDFLGPFEIFATLSDCEVHIVASSLDPILALTGLKFLPTVTLSECPQLDLVCVPGGSGVNDLTTGPEAAIIHAWLRKQAQRARFMTSVCTGSFVLGAAGLLEGKRATSHWIYADLLHAFGAVPVHGERVVEDGQIITAGGVTSGVDFALAVVARLRGDHEAQLIQLFLEYDPKPPFDCGTPARATPELVEAARAVEVSWRRKREDLLETATGKPVQRATWAQR